MLPPKNRNENKTFRQNAPNFEKGPSAPADYRIVKLSTGWKLKRGEKSNGNTIQKKKGKFD